MKLTDKSHCHLSDLDVGALCLLQNPWHHCIHTLAQGGRAKVNANILVPFQKRFVRDGRFDLSYKGNGKAGYSFGSTDDAERGKERRCNGGVLAIRNLFNAQRHRVSADPILGRPFGRGMGLTQCQE